MRRIRFQIGRFVFFLWAGSWSWWLHLDCPHCRNLYVGPFGFEWETPDKEAEYEEEFKQRIRRSMDRNKSILDRLANEDDERTN